MEQAAVVLVDGVPWRAELADCLVVLDDAGRSVVALPPHAGVHALVVLAGQVRRAALVPQADLGLGLAALVALAQRLVVKNNALLPGRARVFAARVATAAAVQAGQVAGALRVVVALRRSLVPGPGGGRAGELSPGVKGELVLADAGGSVLGGLAALVRRRTGVSSAGVSAGAAVALERGVAVAVLPAALVPSSSVLGRAVVGLRPVVRLVRRLRPVVLWRRLLVLGPLVSLGSLGPLGRRLRPVVLGRIPAPLVLAALHVGAPDEACRALAARLVQDDGAEGVVSAGRAHGARVAADAGDAGLVDRAVAVVLAARHFNCWC